MRFEHTPFDFAGIVDARPSGNGWAVLGPDGTLGNTQLDLSGLDLAKPVDLSVAGDCAAIVERYGRRGRVFSQERATLELHRGDYHPEASVFPLAFFKREGRMLLVHGTDWNRLDVSDATTGECLTGRGPTVCTDADDVPAHRLDYFHAGLTVSPDGRWIAEDGWIWHPLGELRVWSLDAWLERNAWESEDGPSVTALTQRVYFWDTPMAWLDSTRLAFWGEGGDADEMKPVVRIYDAVLGHEISRIEGPDVAPAMPWPPGKERGGWLAFDRWLFAVSPEKGTGVWEVATGERVLFESGFAPRRYHPQRKEFLYWDEAGAIVSRLVE